MISHWPDKPYPHAICHYSTETPPLSSVVLNITAWSGCVCEHDLASHSQPPQKEPMGYRPSKSTIHLYHTSKQERQRKISVGGVAGKVSSFWSSGCASVLTLSPPDPVQNWSTSPAWSHLVLRLKERPKLRAVSNTRFFLPLPYK